MGTAWCNNETKPEQLSTFALSSPTSKAADWAEGRHSEGVNEGEEYPQVEEEKERNKKH